ncbi:MAG: hypothetical protein MZV64_60490 [Ignavibacteriales bacterium]|nr:hypothetical protein [Ignavibacteriales bacterium]
MEPLTGLNASWPSFEPAIFSQAMAASASGAPTASTKEFGQELEDADTCREPEPSRNRSSGALPSSRK